MKIRFQSRHGSGKVECRDFLGNDLTIWELGQERDIPDDRVITVRRADGRNFEQNAVDAVLSLGPDFVDATTGINPFFQCVKCNVATTDEGFLTTTGVEPLVDANGDRLCLHCYIADHAEHEARFRQLGLDEAIIAEGQRRGGREPSPITPPGVRTHAERVAAERAAANPAHDPTGDRYKSDVASDSETSNDVAKAETPPTVAPIAAADATATPADAAAVDAMAIDAHIGEPPNQTAARHEQEAAEAAKGA